MRTLWTLVGIGMCLLGATGPLRAQEAGSELPVSPTQSTQEMLQEAFP